jgi:hypothetical protein
MEPYEKKLGPGAKAVITGTRCSVCGFVLLDNDDEVWAALEL